MRNEHLKCSYYSKIKWLTGRLIFCLALLFSGSVIAQEFHPELNYGEYSVGFELIGLEDASRSYTKEQAEAIEARPMVIGVWFPVERGSAYELGLEELYQIAGWSTEIISEEAALIIARETEPLIRIEGNFPLILYAPAQGSNGYGNTVLCEVLASHGYVVATVASKGYWGRQMTFDAFGIEAQTRDLEFLYGFMQTYPSTDISKLGLAGFSFGGLNMLSFALKNRTVDALVSLDGSIEVGIGDLENYPTTKLENLEVSMLAFLGDKSNIAGFPLVKTSPLSDLFLVKTDGLDHFDFGSANIEFRKRPDITRKTYAAMVNRSRLFFDHQLKELSNHNEVTRLDGISFVDMHIRKVEQKPEVRKERFIQFAQEEGVEVAIRVYNTTKEKFPWYDLFDYGAFRDVGFIRMQQNNLEEAILVFRVLVDAYPETPDSYRRLGEALMLSGSYTEARQYLQKGLELDPDSPALKDILRRLDEMKGD